MLLAKRANRPRVVLKDQKKSCKFIYASPLLFKQWGQPWAP